MFHPQFPKYISPSLSAMPESAVMLKSHPVAPLPALPAAGYRQILSRMLLAGSLALVTGLTGCAAKNGDITGSIQSTSSESLRVQADQLRQRYEKQPGEKRVGLQYSSVLRALHQNAQAVAVLEATAIANSKDNEVQAAFGKALAEAGQLDQAALVLASAHSPDRPDWRILSAQGTVADQLGHPEQAQQFYRQALQLAPDEPTVLSNLGLSYALNKRLPEAEQVLRQAVSQTRADPKIRGNLALVLALQGKFKESEQVASRDLSPAESEANAAYVRKMMSQQNSWKQIQKVDKGLKRG